MNPIQKQVEEFHRKFEHPIATSPQLLATDRIGLRLSLIREELDELVHGCLKHDLIECADALGDLLYVAFGMAIEMGLDMEKIVNEIHKSNLSKLDSDGKPIRREDGKILKGSGFVPPNIRTVLGL